MPTPRLRLGQLLVDARMISAAALDEVLAAQKSDGRRLGTLLVERGLINETQLTQILSHQLSVPWVSLLHIEFSRQLLNLVPREVADRFCLVPIYVRHVRNQGETLYVAMEDPANEDGLAACRGHSGLPVRSMIAPPTDIRSAIRVYYGVESRPAPATAPQRSPIPTEPAPPPAPVHPDPPPISSERAESPVTRREPSGHGAEVAAPASEAEIFPPTEVTAAPPVEVTAAPPVEVTAAPPVEVTVAPPVEVTAAPPVEVTAAPPVEVTAAPPVEVTAALPAEVTAPAAEVAAAQAAEPTDAPAVEAATAPVEEGQLPRPAVEGPEIEAVEIPVDLSRAERLRGILDPPETPPPPSSPEVENIPRPRGRAPRMVSLTLLDGTTINLPAKRRARRPVREEDLGTAAAAFSSEPREAPAPPERPSSPAPAGASDLPGPYDSFNGLTARDLVLALRVVAGGADASEVLGENVRWEALFSALLSLLLRKHLIADWEFIDELKKQL